jgi:AcrR family transcriptional regulator
MNVANVTVSATAQGLWLGRQPDHSAVALLGVASPAKSGVTTCSPAPILTNIHTCMYVVKVPDDMRTLAQTRSAARVTPIPSRQEQRTAATRAKLLSAAEHIFARDGFEASRLEDIAARAGFTRGAFYANFDSKEDLLFALMERIVFERVRAVEAILEKHGSPAERLRALRDYYSRIARDREWALLQLEFKLFAVRHPEARLRLVNRYRKLRAPGRELLESLAKTLGGELPISSNGCTVALGAVSNALMVEHLMDPKGLTSDEIQFVLGMVFDALVGEQLRA